MACFLHENGPPISETEASAARKQQQKKIAAVSTIFEDINLDSFPFWFLAIFCLFLVGLKLKITGFPPIMYGWEKKPRSLRYGDLF
ncbi:hypothetical protein Nepgr_027337 [Nepenthes gracilis]|uniref:Uncharacterized protein n=1 Tax=Nepenthes gracilis TaxID=150966 RepID=A0AAD3TA61_NEPGR|nr:hypothetical protein Nepgr_027337 [Nepenthes gracilis]